MLHALIWMIQVVWKSTTQVACAVANCAAGTIFSQPSNFVVCRYTPPGNYAGQFPCVTYSSAMSQLIYFQNHLAKTWGDVWFKFNVNDTSSRLELSSSRLQRTADAVDDPHQCNELN